MTSELQVPVIEKMIKDLLADEPPYFLLEVKIKPTNNVKVFVDGDQGIAIEKCVAINRALYRQIEAANLFPSGDFSLEVSSPGLDEPLKTHRQYLKNIGREVEVVLKDGSKMDGKLLEVDDAGLVIEETRGRGQHGRPSKKLEVLLHKFSFEQIKSTRIRIVF